MRLHATLQQPLLRGPYSTLKEFLPEILDQTQNLNLNSTKTHFICNLTDSNNLTLTKQILDQLFWTVWDRVVLLLIFT